MSHEGLGRVVWSAVRKQKRPESIDMIPNLGAGASFMALTFPSGLHAPGAASLGAGASASARLYTYYFTGRAGTD